MSHLYHRYLRKRARETSINTKIIEEKAQREKSMLLAYFLWLFTGVIGGHRFYLGRHFSAFMLLLAFVSLMVSFYHIELFLLLFILIPTPPYIIFAAFWFWILLFVFDLFWTASAVNKINRSLKKYREKEDNFSCIQYPTEPK
ncbi:TM2 domain-containing protein [Kiloniella laminariae]|uniref:TM2 domain-containing protein n=1 Tax=Kiloniella laminariae TaxID=454162 RepID=A0ABT4LFM4_9PROT|nr:TM2 domain-containing protein [Kiloniella laminariae]MCZ4279892.1 TM2 domain-containing protein [Kiloniella laminariae]